MLKPLPIGIQSIEKLLEGKYLYIDKTEYIYNLLKSSGYHFLSKPRRFGKSLLLSTLEAVFLGRRELFKGLWIDKSDYKWEEYSVIRIDFTQIYNKEPEEFKNELKRRIIEIGEEYQIQVKRDIPFPGIFRDLVKGLYKIRKQRVVILIDEYDKPIIDNITEIEIAKKNKIILKDFYGVIKGVDEYLRFVMLTGVTKFSKLSIFSDLNNLNDITISEKYGGILGCTEEELIHYFGEYIELLREKEGVTLEEIKKKIAKWYNGYSFSKNDLKLYNPFSILLLFENNDFRNYWFETGTPTFLINLIKERNYELKSIEYEGVSDIAFSSYEVENIPITPLLFQTGYLTIVGYNEKRMEYKLYYPNYEVKQSFLSYLAGSYSNIEPAKIDNYLWKLVDALEEEAIERFFETLEIFFANINYELHIKSERYYQTIFYVIFKLIGLKVEAEISTNKGRIDAVIEIKDKVYIFEFKINKSSEKALKQIKKNKYYEKYIDSEKKITCVGVEFSVEERNIISWTVE